MKTIVMKSTFDYLTELGVNVPAIESTGIMKTTKEGVKYLLIIE